MTKKQETITIPMSLARLLVSEPEDMRDPKDYQNVHDVARASLRLLMKAGA